MTRPTYEQALVPEHLTKLTIEKLPFEKPFYVTPGERDDYEAPSVFVTADRRLMMARSAAIDMDAAYPASPLGLIGVMRVPLIGADNNVREAYVADLRFLEDHQLVDTDDMQAGVVDQEEYMAWAEAIANSVQFEAFIAPEAGEDIDDGAPSGTFYGNPELYDFLKKLRKRGNKRMKKFMQREAKADPKLATALPVKPAAKADKSADLTPVFLPPKHL